MKGASRCAAVNRKIEEIRRVTRREGLRFRFHPAEVGRLVNGLRQAALMLEALPPVDCSPDPYDNFLLAMAEAADAQWLVTDDKRGLLTLQTHRATRIVTAQDALARLVG